MSFRTFLLLTGRLALALFLLVSPLFAMAQPGGGAILAPGGRYQQNQYSSHVYFEKPDAHPCTAQFLWRFGDGDSSQNCNPVHLYATDGTYPITLLVSDQFGQDTFVDVITVGIPKPNARFRLSPQFQNLIELESSTAEDETWDPAWNGLTQAWDIGGNQSVGTSASVPFGATGTFTSAKLTATNGAGESDTYEKLVYKGYSKDFPTKHHGQCTRSAHFTPMEWIDKDYVFVGDADGDRIHDSVTSGDILLYYHIPKSFSHPQIRLLIETELGGRIDRFSRYITVVSARNVDSLSIRRLITRPYILYIDDDTPKDAYTSQSSGTMNLDPTDLVRTLKIRDQGTDNCPGFGLSHDFPFGAGISIGILGAGRDNHIAFAGHRERVCDTANFAGYLGETYFDFTGEVVDSACNYDLDSTNFMTDLHGIGASHSAVLTSQAYGHMKGGISPKSEYFYLKVTSTTPTSSKTRKSDVIEAMDWVITSMEKDYSVNVVVCDFNLREPSDGKDAVSAIFHVATRFGLLCIAGTGFEGGAGITAPAAAGGVIAVAPAVTGSCNTSYSIPPAAGTAATSSEYWAKPDLSAPANILGASHESRLKFDQPSLSSEVSAMVLAGLIAPSCEIRSDLTNDKVKLLATVSALPTPQARETEGHGRFDGEAFRNKLYDLNTSGVVYDLGFSQNINSDTLRYRHLSNNVRLVNLDDKMAGDPMPRIKSSDTLVMEVRVENRGTNDYPGNQEDGLVKIGFHQFGPSSISILSDDITRMIPFVAAGDEATIVFEVPVNFSTDALCISAEIICLGDTSAGNNQAKRNDYRIQVPEETTDFLVPVYYNVPFGGYLDVEIRKEERTSNRTSDSTGCFTIASSDTGGIVCPADLPRWIWHTITYQGESARTSRCSTDFEFTFVDKNHPLNPGEAGCAYLGGYRLRVFSDGATSTREPTSFQIQVYPNPTQGSFKLSFLPSEHGIASISLFDMVGKPLGKWEVDVLSAVKKEVPLDLADFPAGTYFVQVSSGGVTQVKKVIKMN